MEVNGWSQRYLPVSLVYLARATSKRVVKLEEMVVVLGIDDMGLGLNGSERLRTLTVGEEGKGREEIDCVFGGFTLLQPRTQPLAWGSTRAVLSGHHFKALPAGSEESSRAEFGPRKRR